MSHESIVKKVELALEEIRPFLAEDGGDIALVEVTSNMIARVMFKGACSSCSMSNMTFKAGVQDTILHAVPEIVKVEAVSN
jgi:Fe-S cluster biogenesis protein NfuA